MQLASNGDNFQWNVVFFYLEKYITNFSSAELAKRVVKVNVKISEKIPWNGTTRSTAFQKHRNESWRTNNYKTKVSYESQKRNYRRTSSEMQGNRGTNYHWMASRNTAIVELKPVRNRKLPLIMMQFQITNICPHRGPLPHQWNITVKHI